MEMTLRWYGKDNDSVSLEQIKQIPNVKGVITAFYDIEVGEVWPYERIMALKKEINDAGLKLSGIESVNVHEDIKLGLPSRDKYIENYKKTLENLGKAGINMVCYNFMPVFDWTRSDLAKKIHDGSTVLSYDEDKIKEINPIAMIENIENDSNGFEMPGWEPYRLKEIKRLFELYKDVSDDDLWNNLKYFLEAIMPVCDTWDIDMAIHPDDPPWPIFGLPRIIINDSNLERFIKMVDNKHNGLTLCSGSLGANKKNNIPEIVRKYGKMGRIHFAHIRNVKIHEDGKFDEAAHLSECGSLDLFEIIKAYHEVGFKGPIRPDHGRMIWNEKAMPGYGLYDRALGVTYMNGLIESIRKMEKSS